MNEKVRKSVGKIVVYRNNRVYNCKRMRNFIQTSLSTQALVIITNEKSSETSFTKKH